MLEYDDVMNTQRKVIYQQRQQVLDGEDISESIRSMYHSVIETNVNSILGQGGYISDRDQFNTVVDQFEGLFIPKGSFTATDAELNDLDSNAVIEKVTAFADEAYAKKEAELGMVPGTDTPLMREIERVFLLRVVDEYWMDHIDAMSELRQGITLRAYANTDPVIEYKREGYDMFEAMINAIREETVRRVFLAKLAVNQPVERKKVAEVTNTGSGDGTLKRKPVKKKVKVGRNDPCPCGSGKKFKHCCIDKGIYD